MRLGIFSWYQYGGIKFIRLDVFNYVLFVYLGICVMYGFWKYVKSRLKSKNIYAYLQNVLAILKLIDCNQNRACCAVNKLSTVVQLTQLNTNNCYITYEWINTNRIILWIKCYIFIIILILAENQTV